MESKKSGPNEKKKSYNDFLEIFFSFKYDFQKILTIKNLIPYFSNENKNELVFYEKKLIKSLPLIKGNKDEFAIYKFILKYSPNINNKFIFESTIRKLKLLMKMYFNKLIFRWEEDCEFSELCNFINDNILLFCKLFLNLKDSLEDRKNKINFFFDEFIHVLNPEFKEKFRQYKELSLDYLNFTRDDDEYYYNCESDIYFSMMFIFIRLKFGKYNPTLLYKYLCIINSSIDTFLLFLKAYFNNSNKKDIPYHFFLIDSNLSLLYPDKYKFYFKYFFGQVDRYIIKEEFVLYFFISLHKLRKIKFSLIFDYIILVFNDYNSSSENIFKFIFPGINFEQNEELFELITNLKFLKFYDKAFYSFLDIEPILYNNEEIIKYKIKTMKQISIYLSEKKELIFSNETLKPKITDLTNENLFLFFKVLKRENDSFCNCVKNNRFLLKLSLLFLLKNYYFYLFKEKGKNLLNEKEELKLMKNEIYNFLDL